MPASDHSLFARRALRIAALRAAPDPGAEAARAQFRLDYAARDRRLSLYALDVTPANAAPDQAQDVDALEAHDAPRMYFEIYRAERVSLTSILFSGEDWRWRFCASDGQLIAGSEGYASEEACRFAVELLRRGAGTADCRDGTGPERGARRAR